MKGYNGIKIDIELHKIYVVKEYIIALKTLDVSPRK
jgi:hypothetical protein